MKKSDNFFPILTVFDNLAKVISEGVQNPFGFSNQTPLDIVEKENHYLVRLSLAGFSKEEVKIKKSGEQLLITAEKQSKKEEDKEKFYYKERVWSKNLYLFTNKQNVFLWHKILLLRWLCLN